MTDVSASDFRHPRRYVRLDTILRLRWLAALGQLAAIFVVVQGLEYDMEIIPCVTIIGLSASLNLVLQTLFNPVHRLEPLNAAALLALNITGIPFLGLMGTVGAVAVAVAVLIAISFTPAMLSLVGFRILRKKERDEIGHPHVGRVPTKAMATWRAIVTLVVVIIGIQTIYDTLIV